MRMIELQKSYPNNNVYQMYVIIDFFLICKWRV
jgi:hypothetical protein